MQLQRLLRLQKRLMAPLRREKPTHIQAQWYLQTKGKGTMENQRKIPKIPPEQGQIIMHQEATQCCPPLGKIYSFGIYQGIIVSNHLMAMEGIPDLVPPLGVILLKNQLIMAFLRRRRLLNLQMDNVSSATN